jgi:DNA ligase-1
MEETHLPILYHAGRSGKLYSWRCWSTDDIVHTEYGTVDGLKSYTCKEVVGKNIGKSNETTPIEQAVLKAKSMYTNKLERKYSLTPEIAVKPVFLPMLAKNYEDHKNKVEYPVDVQPKFDGVRCLAHWIKNDDGTTRVQLLSRSGKEYSVRHIREAVEAVLPSGFVFDGELYIHGETLQTVNKLVKKHRDGSDGSVQLRFYIYDYFNKSSPNIIRWESRRDALNIIFETARSPLIRVVTKTASSEIRVQKLLEQFIVQGYEGAIVRMRDGLYEIGHRSPGLLKLKKFFDEEFEVVGHHTGSGNEKDCVVWDCISSEGIQFGVVPMGGRELRREWLKNAESYYGKMFKVKFWSKSEDLVPMFPIGIDFRLPEDMDSKDDT